MHRRFRLTVRQLSWFICTCLVLSVRTQAQMLDLNGNSMSDVWEQVYRTAALPPTLDRDHDGVLNGQEAVAGTDPFDSNSIPKITLVTSSGGTVTVGMFGALGKRYELQSLGILGGTSNWVSEANSVLRSGSMVTLNGTADLNAKFFRIVVSDVDTDGDGLNDWEEYKLGLDPLNASSSFQLDGNGQPMNDYNYAVAKFASQNVVSIAAIDPVATEPDPGQEPLGMGAFAVTRGGFPLNSITVNLALGGPGTGFAVEGVDHAPLPRTVMFPVGVSTVVIPVNPLANPNLKESVIATLKEIAGNSYAVGIQSNASVVIYPSSTPLGTGLTAQYFNNASPTYSDPLNFSGTSVTRIDPQIDVIWGSLGSPNAAVNRDNFSAVWEGRLVPSTTGSFLFDLQADDGARLYINNQLVIDAWPAGSSSANPIQSLSIPLDATTNYPIRVEYYELTNAAMIHLRWSAPNAGSFVSIPTANVLRPGTNLPNWAASYYNNTTFSGTPVYTNFETAVYYDWYSGSPDPAIAVTTYSARWTGQVLPEYSEPYTFVVRSDDGAKLWVNGQLILDDWRSKSVSDTNSVTINLQGGVRYDIKLEYFQNTGSAEAHLSWYSPSQPKQIVPMARLYPSGSPAASSVTSPMTAVGFLGQPFSFTLTGANVPLGYTATGLPPGLGFNGTNGVISGVPSLAGHFQIAVTVSNTVGASASVLDLDVFDTGSAVTREVWTGVPGTNISDIPIGSPPTSLVALGALEGIDNFGDNYGERIRGYLTAPVTGNYYFWIAGNDAAELWISNDGEPANKVLRARTTGGTSPRQWPLQPKQRSPWLTLVAGQKYYVEVLHKAGVGTNDNWSVGWRQDSTGTNVVPTGVVPSYLLSRHFDAPPAFIPGTLYSANLLAQAGAISSGVGSGTLRLSADETEAVVKFSYSSLSSPFTAAHIHADTYLGKNSQGQIIFDIDAATPEPDGSYVWHIAQSGPLTSADIVEIIKQGKSYLNVHTVNYPGGEINGHFTFAEGSQTFTPPPPPAIWADDHSDANAAARFLLQATFGPSSNEIASVQALGYDGWIANQFALPATHHLPTILATVSADPSNPYSGNQVFNTWWMNSVTAQDQLRQRVAFALSEILVTSESGVLQDNAPALSHYYDILLDNAFGNFRELLESVTLSPAMGLYLDMRRNDKGDIILGTHPNENYAREILQLFSVGLNRMWPDGTLVMSSKGDLVPTYDQDVILGFARVFTGWNYYQVNPTNAARLGLNWNQRADYTNSMVAVIGHHELGSKLLLDNAVLPPAYGSQTDLNSTNYDSYTLQDFEIALDSICNNQNVGPFICRQLIQRLVTSHPSRDYMYRVVQKFNDNGAGVRGDLQAVIRAILLDYEARGPATLAVPTYGKQREPVLRVTAAARAFPAPPSIPGTYSQGGTATITISTAPTPHRLNNNDDLFLAFTDTSGQPAPPSQGYNNVSVTSPTTFTVGAPGIVAATYSQTASTITVTNASHGFAVGDFIYLQFTTGGASNGTYQVDTVPASGRFTVVATDSASRSGACLYPKLTGGGFVVQNSTNLLASTALPHGLAVGNSVYLTFTQPGSPPNGIYQVATVTDATHYSAVVPSSGNQTQNGLTTYPLGVPALVRSGNVLLRFSTWAMNATDGGATSSLSQTPLNSPTVFNFFFPEYKFPGVLASAGLTTPEFQLTSDTSVVLQMNFMESAILASTSNTNGLISFSSGNGAIMLDTGPWMTPAYTSNGGVSNLVQSLNTLLCAGQLSAGARATITSYVTSTNFPYTTPTASEMRERVRAAVHLIVSAPDFVIQK